MASPRIIPCHLFHTALYILSACLIWTSTECLLRHSRAGNFHYAVQMFEDTPPEENSVSGEAEHFEKGKGTAVGSLSTSFKDCGSHSSIKSLTVSPCDGSTGKKGNSDICRIERGANVTFNLNFVPSVNATQLKAVIHGIYDFVPIPFPCPQPNACQDSGIQCPIQAGQAYDYQLRAQVLSSYPKIKLWIKGQLEDENGDNVVCVKIHVQLT